MTTGTLSDTTAGPDESWTQMEIVAGALGVPVPKAIFDSTERPTPEFLAWCARYRACLDFIFCGDPHQLIKYAASDRRRNRPKWP